MLSSSNLFHSSLHCFPTFSQTFQVSTAQTFQEHYANSLSLIPSARAHFGRGTCLAALRRRLEAMAELEKAKELCPKMVGAIINLAGLGLGNIWIFLIVYIINIIILTIQIEHADTFYVYFVQRIWLLYSKIHIDCLKCSTMSETYVFNKMILFIGIYLVVSGLSSDCSRRPTGFVIVCWSRTKLSRSLAFGAGQSRSCHATWTWPNKNAEISQSLTWSPYKKTNERTQRW